MFSRPSVPNLVGGVPMAKVAGDMYRVAGLFGVGEGELAMIFLAPALGFPELFTLLIVCLLYTSDAADEVCRV